MPIDKCPIIFNTFRLYQLIYSKSTLLIDNMKNPPAKYTTPTAYFLYNYIFQPVKPKEVFIFI
jgi:hypothetical protein